jgi:hypothetical protein
MQRITWFTNAHEQRNHLLKYGFMKLHHAGTVEFIVRDQSALAAYDVSPGLRQHEHRHTTLLLWEHNTRKRWILVDSEDSFAQLCPLIEDVDVYFCAGYNHPIFHHKTFLQPYPWQTAADVASYRLQVEQMIQRWGDHFSKVKKYVPIGPDSGQWPTPSWPTQKWRNLRDKTQKTLTGQRYWQPEFQVFEQRYRAMHALRSATLQYDVVLADTLWGWPHHRYALHQKLGQLAPYSLIYSQLKWNDAALGSGLTSEQFPLISRPIAGNYEAMLAASRLAVFATGFHWGWRNIMTLALYWGLPIYMDQPLLEPYFDFNQFKVFYNIDEWQSLESYLQDIDEALWHRIKAHNQAIYDRYLLPEKVAQYVLDTVI